MGCGCARHAVCARCLGLAEQDEALAEAAKLRGALIHGRGFGKTATIREWCALVLAGSVPVSSADALDKARETLRAWSVANVIIQPGYERIRAMTNEALAALTPSAAEPAAATEPAPESERSWDERYDEAMQWRDWQTCDQLIAERDAVPAVDWRAEAEKLTEALRLIVEYEINDTNEGLSAGYHFAEVRKIARDAYRAALAAQGGAAGGQAEEETR